MSHLSTFLGTVAHNMLITSSNVLPYIVGMIILLFLIYNIQNKYVQILIAAALVVGLLYQTRVLV